MHRDPPIDVAARDQAAAIETSLRDLGTPERAAAERAYLKSNLEFTGTTVPAIRATIGTWLKTHPDLDRDLLVGLASALWARPVHECRQAAVVLLEHRKTLLTPADVSWLESLLRSARTWALVDGLAATVAGHLAERHPGEINPVLDRWSADPDFWLRRSALLALMGPLRQGGGDFARFAGYADQMLPEKEFFIRKAIGWVLRETAKRRPDLVAGWLGPRLDRASGVTVREAVRPMDPALRDQILRGYRERRAISWPANPPPG